MSTNGSRYGVDGVVVAANQFQRTPNGASLSVFLSFCLSAPLSLSVSLSLSPLPSSPPPPSPLSTLSGIGAGAQNNTCECCRIPSKIPTMCHNVSVT